MRTSSLAQASDFSLSLPPDGGSRAWTQVLCMHFVFFNTWGVSNSFSVYQQLYTATFTQSASEISWIGSVQVFLIFFIGVLAGRATDAGYFRLIYSTGVLLQLLGIFMLSLCKTYWQVFLAQALCMGLGNGLIFTPGLSVTSSYFEKNRALAVGLAASGAATGGMIYPVVVDQLLYRANVGFGWTTRATGLVMLVTHLPGMLLYKPRLPPRTTGPLVEWEAFTELSFVFITASMFLNFWGLYFAFFYLGTFARDQIGIENTQNLVLVLNGVGVVSRILPTLIGDRVLGRLNTLIPFSFASSVVVYCWIPVSTHGGLYAFAAVYGVVGGAVQALFPASITSMSPDIKKNGTRVGMILSIVSIATLTGPAIEGALIHQAGGSYLYAQVFAATSILVGAFAAVAARVAKAGWAWNVKA
ncbi:major facilitator superfamily domain-containing protein [Aspergillus ambiguus]|uniref:major facilitator superfamily domain-containing protein n=1 Tax=Aspergillus ambiguus TaxID=176160 RepID=UPI003CCDE324